MRRKNDDKRVKLLISIINTKDEELLTQTVNSCCTAMHFSGMGNGTARSHYKSYFGFNETEKRVVFSLIPERCEHSLLNEIGRALRLYLIGRGIAFTTPLSAISNIIEDAIFLSPERDTPKNTKSPVSKKEKSTMHELVIAVVNEKYSDSAIDAARTAGATGATVFNTRSIDNARVEQNMGTALPDETIAIFFLTTSEYKLKIMEAVRESAGLKTDGSAVIFSVPVDDMVGIGRFDGEISEDE